ncbi:MAG: putative toxin-antitoxin system toxin component, PIN family [Alphaproteobacteria bacterium]|nr:putative toxin-antitoxin system toxin component, PIN family [Alphaproteobacteria bacterium]
MRIVLDTDVVVAGMRSPRGASAALLLAGLDRRVTFLVSVPLMLEYEAICRLAEHRLASGLSLREVDVFLDALAALAEPIESRFLWRPLLRDPGDEMVLETAINGQAKAIATFNIRDFGDAPARFGVSVARPGDILRRIQS